MNEEIINILTTEKEYLNPHDCASILSNIINIFKSDNNPEGLSIQVLKELKLFDETIFINSINEENINVKYDAIVANPPFSAKWSADKSFLEDNRFKMYGKLAPKSKADYAFIQHMIHYLNETGTMAVVVPHGVLFRGSAEGVIRKYLVNEKNYLDAVIGLPSNLFYGTSIPTAILIFKKSRTSNDDILFIDASKEFEKVKNQIKLRVEDIEKIINTYANREEIDKYSHKASLEEIEENDFNLNIPRYVDTFEEEEPIDLDEIIVNLRKINEEEKKVDAEIKKYCDELGIQAPIF